MVSQEEGLSYCGRGINRNLIIFKVLGACFAIKFKQSLIFTQFSVKSQVFNFKLLFDCTYKYDISYCLIEQVDLNFFP